MKRLLSNGLVFLGGLVAVAVPASQCEMVQRTPPQDYRSDPRLVRLRTFFVKMDCPARAYAREFLEAADQYHLDWRLLPSISFIESTGGKMAQNNNFFGWDSGAAHFDSPEAGIYTVGYQLSHSRLYRWKDLDAILATYNPYDQYGAKVKSVMQQIAPDR
jgi:hypothetical protein